MRERELVGGQSDAFGNQGLREEVKVVSVTLERLHP
jgi:hypothetical protein